MALDNPYGGGCVQDQDGDEAFAKHKDFGYLTVDPLDCRLGFSLVACAVILL